MHIHSKPGSHQTQMMQRCQRVAQESLPTTDASYTASGGTAVVLLLLGSYALSVHE